MIRHLVVVAAVAAVDVVCPGDVDRVDGRVPGVHLRRLLQRVQHVVWHVVLMCR